MSVVEDTAPPAASAPMPHAQVMQIMSGLYMGMFVAILSSTIVTNARSISVDPVALRAAVAAAVDVIVAKAAEIGVGERVGTRAGRYTRPAPQPDRGMVEWQREANVERRGKARDQVACGPIRMRID